MRKFLVALGFIYLTLAAAVAQFGGGGNQSQCGQGDLDGSCQVISQHFSAALPIAAGGTATTNGHAAGVNRVLCSIRAANFNSTADQACIISASVTAWVLSSIIVTNCSASLMLVAGGVYPAASKGGVAFVSAAQTFIALTGATVVFGLPLAANISTTRQTVNTVYLSLTTGAGSAATCDFYLIGMDLT